MKFTTVIAATALVGLSSAAAIGRRDLMRTVLGPNGRVELVPGLGEKRDIVDSVDGVLSLVTSDIADVPVVLPVVVGKRQETSGALDNLLTEVGVLSDAAGLTKRQLEVLDPVLAGVDDILPLSDVTGVLRRQDKTATATAPTDPILAEVESLLSGLKTKRQLSGLNSVLSEVTDALPLSDLTGLLRRQDKTATANPIPDPILTEVESLLSGLKTKRQLSGLNSVLSEVTDALPLSDLTGLLRRQDKTATANQIPDPILTEVEALLSGLKTKRQLSGLNSLLSGVTDALPLSDVTGLLSGLSKRQLEALNPILSDLDGILPLSDVTGLLRRTGTTASGISSDPIENSPLSDITGALSGLLKRQIEVDSIVSDVTSLLPLSEVDGLLSGLSKRQIEVDSIVSDVTGLLPLSEVDGLVSGLTKRQVESLGNIVTGLLPLSEAESLLSDLTKRQLQVSGLLGDVADILPLSDVNGLLAPITDKRQLQVSGLLGDVADVLPLSDVNGLLAPITDKRQLSVSGLLSGVTDALPLSEVTGLLSGLSKRQLSGLNSLLSGVTDALPLSEVTGLLSGLSKRQLSSVDGVLSDVTGLVPEVTSDLPLSEVTGLLREKRQRINYTEIIDGALAEAEQLSGITPKRQLTSDVLGALCSINECPDAYSLIQSVSSQVFSLTGAINSTAQGLTSSSPASDLLTALTKTKAQYTQLSTLLNAAKAQAGKIGPGVALYQDKSSTDLASAMSSMIVEVEYTVQSTISLFGQLGVLAILSTVEVAVGGLLTAVGTIVSGVVEVVTATLKVVLAGVAGSLSGVLQGVTFLA